MPIEPYKTGEQGSVSFHVRFGGRCPARDFLVQRQKPDRKKFDGSFEALVRIGASYQNSQRFKPLAGAGKPMWEFKEHDQRLYCRRTVRGTAVDVVLLTGWAKDKTKGNQEKAEIEKAINRLEELESERG